MGVRVWAAFGNVLKIFSLPLFIGSGLAAFSVVQLAQRQASTGLIVVGGIVSVVGFVFALLFWFAKGPLVSGSVVARFLVGLYMLLWVVTSLGFGLIVIVLVYLFTGEPETYGSSVFRRDEKPVKPRFARPVNWQATGRVGPSGAMLYATAERESPVGIFDSYLPVQVVDKRDGLARVIAATGEGGWIDDRTLTEGV